MRWMNPFVLAAIAALGVAPPAVAADSGAFVVTIAAPLAAPSGGRLVILFSQKPPGPSGAVRVDDLHPEAVFVTSIDVRSVAAGSTITVPFGSPGFPDRPSQAPAGTYNITAYLDVNRHFAYSGAEPNDLAGPTVRDVDITPNATIAVTLDHVVPQAEVTHPVNVTPVEFASPALSQFAGHAVMLHAVVVAPPGASPSLTYPTSYMIGGFGATQNSNLRQASRLASDVKAGTMPQMFYVLLDPSAPTGHDVFADSDNNGPYGRALTTEFIPFLESRFPGMRSSAGDRFLTGHSSGGWSTLWLQVTYPDVFGGTWSTSPDPVDFHSFTGPNLFTDGNFYHRPDGTAYNLIRDHGRDVMTLRDSIRLEDVEGASGGQFRSFDAVFSPRGADGKPEELFDHVTGEIHPAVAHAWERYDIATILRANWPVLGPKLAGKIHIIVGTADTFHLNEAVALLATELQSLGSDAKITFLADRDHFDLYRGGLQAQIANEMIAAAKP